MRRHVLAQELTSSRRSSEPAAGPDQRPDAEVRARNSGAPRAPSRSLARRAIAGTALGSIIGTDAVPMPIAEFVLIALMPSSALA